MKPTSFKLTSRILLTLALTFAFPSAVFAFVTLSNNQWVVTSGSGGSVTLSGSLTTNGNLIANGTVTANGTMNANVINANSVLTYGTLTSTGQLWAQSTFYVSGTTTLQGSATTYGDFSAYNGIDLGRAAGNGALSALQMDYYSTLKTASFDLTDSFATFRWQDNIISGTARPKMKLDASNVLTLYNNTTGGAAVTITPSTGKIDLMGATGAGIYSNNVPVIAVGTAGATSVTSSSLTVTGTTILNGQVTLAAPQGDISMGDYAN